MTDNGWNEYSKLVLHELERLDKDLKKDAIDLIDFRDCVKKSFEKVKIDLAVLKVKAGIWGFVGAAIPIALWIAIEIFLHYKFGKPVSTTPPITP